MNAHERNAAAKAHGHESSPDVVLDITPCAPILGTSCGNCHRCQPAGDVPIPALVCERCSRLLAECADRESERGDLRDRVTKAETAVARVEAVCKDTDGAWLDGAAEIPVGEVIAALEEPGRG